MLTSLSVDEGPVMPVFTGAAMDINTDKPI
jgi:hypothetical protein